MTSTIVWIDDDIDMLRQQKAYLEEAGYMVKQEEDVDNAIDYLMHNAGGVLGIIVDCMMSPGRALQGGEHQAGLRTGLVLLNYLMDRGVVRQAGPPFLFIYTHRLDAQAAEGVREKGFNYYQKQDYAGSKIKRLVDQEFGRSM